MRLSLYRFFLLSILTLLSASAFSWDGSFDGFNCPQVTCDVAGSCTAVEQCLYVDSSAPHCRVNEGGATISCNDIQSQNFLKGEGQCGSLGDGSQVQPWCTIEQASSGAKAGSLVLVAPGRYLVPGGTHGLNDFSTDATATSPIVFRNAAFDPANPAIPSQRVTVTPFTAVDGWSQLAQGADYLVCKHTGITADASTFNGIATNIRHVGKSKPLMRLFNEGCGVTNSTEAVNKLDDLNWLPDIRNNAQGQYVQIWNNGQSGGSSHCPAVKNIDGEIAVRVTKSTAIQSCADLVLDVTGVGYTVHLKSTRDLCGDLEEVLADHGLTGFNDEEADHIRFEGLTIEGGNYGLTIETDGVALSYSQVQGAYKDGVKAIGNEPWDYRSPNQCKRLDNVASNNQPTPSVADLIQYCETKSGPLQVGNLLSPPACDQDILDVDTLNPSFFYWPLNDEMGREAMRSARDASIDGHCVEGECVYQSKQHLQKYCREVVPTFRVDAGGQQAAQIPDNCNDFYYFNAQNVTINNNDIRHNGEEGIDITGGDNWTVTNNTIHDSIVTHGAAQMPAGILSKNVSHHNRIESNLLYNIHHSITGILALGGSPVKAGGAVDVVAKDNVILSVSGEKIMHMPNCTNCVLAHNLILDTVIGEEGSRGRGLLHVGGHRKNCVTSTGVQIDCGGEKRSAAFAGQGNSVVNNVVELLKWRDVDAYRMLSFGGYKTDKQSEYEYNGDKALCVSGNHIRGGQGITAVTTHVSAADVSELSCALPQARTDAGVSFTHPRVAACINLIEQGELEHGGLAACLADENLVSSGTALALVAPAIFAELGLSTTQNVSQALGVCSTNQQQCATDEQCGAGSCVIDTTDETRCMLGPTLTSNGQVSDCDLSWTKPLTPMSSTENAYPQFSWKAVTGDTEFQFLLYRFHPDGGTNNAHWYELLANDTVPAAVCDSGNTCFYRAPGLLTDGTYTWKVKRHTDFGWSSWSSTQVFYVNEPERMGHAQGEATGLNSPLMSEHVNNNPTLSWQYDPFAQSYSVLLYRYDDGYELLVNLKLDADTLNCDYVSHCQASVSQLLQLMSSAEQNLIAGTYTWKTKKWTGNTASAWNNPTHVFYVD
jgi:parallel beta-helix repeat protein